MRKALTTRYYQFREHAQVESLISAVKMSLYKHEVILPVEKDLGQLKEVKPNFDSSRYSIVEIDQDSLTTSSYTYAFKSRQQKAQGYFDNGFKSFAIVIDEEVVGDLWYVTRSDARLDHIHPRLKWFGIELAEDEVFMFDLFVVPDERGKAITTYFFSNALNILHDRGYTKAYGDYVSGNIPAMWLHRILGYKERPGIDMKRYFLYESATPLAPGKVPGVDANQSL